MDFLKFIVNAEDISYQIQVAVGKPNWPKCYSSQTAILIKLHVADIPSESWGHPERVCIHVLNT